MGKIFTIILFLYLLGCATGAIHYGYQDYMGPVEVRITSQPSGTKIIINNKYVGITPLKIIIRRKGYLDKQLGKFVADHPLVISAYPSTEGEYHQVRYIDVFDPIPSKIHFDMYSHPSKPQRILLP